MKTVRFRIFSKSKLFKTGAAFGERFPERGYFKLMQRRARGARLAPGPNLRPLAGALDSNQAEVQVEADRSRSWPRPSLRQKANEAA
jgi:hypothetical protein